MYILKFNKSNKEVKNIVRKFQKFNCLIKQTRERAIYYVKLI